MFAAVVSFSLGVLAALYRDSWVDQVIRLISVAAVCDTIILVGLSYLFNGSLWNWIGLPSGGFVPFSESQWGISIP